MVLRFKCECSDEKCTERIPLKLSTYQELHEDRGTYIVKVGHQVDEIEEVIRSTPEYNVVMKNHSTPEPGADLNDTTVDNSGDS